MRDKIEAIVRRACRESWDMGHNSPVPCDLITQLIYNSTATKKVEEKTDEIMDVIYDVTGKR